METRPSLHLRYLDVLSAIAYGFNKDWRQVIYWLVAATLSACVTYR